MSVYSLRSFLFRGLDRPEPDYLRNRRRHLATSSVPMCLRARMLSLRDIDKGVPDATGIKLVIYFIKILYFNHSSSFLSNNFAHKGGTNCEYPLQPLLAQPERCIAKGKSMPQEVMALQKTPRPPIVVSPAKSADLTPALFASCCKHCGGCVVF